ncbi:hypothetical protein ABI_36240 [Asticcacaulis biprosthecium C19]|uniref:Uncharacterized protein n=1 Tax=Asticcacaulis biprosthecium C19 TaxID=715226 RepID=F4QQV8_9CAUL|nr:hypothetical protein [Asticcacaulis biprosthecium]EGF90595.1 hypothetical protein ABI_36240 [Asticcacaulis biprosthecium C19]
MILPVWMRCLGLAAGVLTVAGVSQAQESAESAAQRPLAPLPNVTPSHSAVAAGIPKWSQFPTPPADIPTVAQFGQRVKTQTAASDKLATEVRALVWDKEQPEPYAAAAIARINPVYLKPVDAVMSVEDIERLAEGLRRRAVPPPVAD